MAHAQVSKAAELIEVRRLGAKGATGIPTVSDWHTAGEIDSMYEEEFARRLEIALADERKVSEARVVDALDSAVNALSRESIGFQAGWGSNEIDVAKLDILDKALAWLKKRRDKYTDTLPRIINLRDTYKDLSDGAKIEVDSVVFTHWAGFGEFRSDDGAIIKARNFNKQVKLIDHNL